MTSLLTNYAAMSAVRTLSATQAALASTQSQISTGLKVASAKDNAAYWSIATSMKTRIGELQAVNDGLDVTAGILSTTSAALDQILTLTQGIAKDVVSAQTEGVDQSKIAVDIAAKQQGIISAAMSASYNGVNWLVDKATNVYSGSDEWTWAGTYNDVHRSNETTPIAYSFHSTLTIQTTLSQGSESSSTEVIPTDAAGTFTPATGIYVETSHPGLITTTGTPGEDYHLLSLMMTTGNPTTFDLRPLSLFGAYTDVDAGLVDHETFAGGDSRYFPAFFILPNPNGITLSGGALTQPIALSGNATSTVLSFDPTKLSHADLAAVGSGVAGALESLQTAMSFVGSLQNEVDGSKSLNSVIVDALQSGVGSLVDADMNATSTRLMALQTQQQLGIQALGIANDNSQIILKLFG